MKSTTILTVLNSSVLLEHCLFLLAFLHALEYQFDMTLYLQQTVGQQAMTTARILANCHLSTFFTAKTILSQQDSTLQNNITPRSNLSRRGECSRWIHLVAQAYRCRPALCLLIRIVLNHEVMSACLPQIGKESPRIIDLLHQA